MEKKTPPQRQWNLDGLNHWLLGVKVSVFIIPDKCLKVGVISLGFEAFFWVPMPNGDAVRINTSKIF